MENLNKETIIIQNTVKAQEKSLAKFINLRLLVFLSLTVCSVINLFNEFDLRLCLIILPFIYKLFSAGVRCALRDSSVKQGDKVVVEVPNMKQVFSKEGIGTTKMYSNRYKRYKSDISKYL